MQSQVGLGVRAKAGEQFAVAVGSNWYCGNGTPKVSGGLVQRNRNDLFGNHFVGGELATGV
jgi:hypothetical protein